jgi:hypothetical protein
MHVLDGLEVKLCFCCVFRVEPMLSQPQMPSGMGRRRAGASQTELAVMPRGEPVLHCPTASPPPCGSAGMITAGSAVGPTIVFRIRRQGGASRSAKDPRAAPPGHHPQGWRNRIDRVVS